jgi:preprotein translocase subunit YajC
MLLPAMMVAVVVFMLLSARSQRKREQRTKDEMHAKLSKNDRVLTIGGVVGTIVSVKDTEVVLKVDESTNTKMTFVKTAIQRILADGPAVGDPPR